MIILRNFAFYVAFYFGSPVFVIFGLVAMFTSRRLFNRIVKAWGNYHRLCVRWLLGIKLKIEGNPRQGAVFYVIKHESMFEAIDLLAQFEFPSAFAKKELFKIPGWGRVAETYGLVPVARDEGAKALRTMVGAARKQAGKGRELVLFPEGTRVPHGTTAPLKSGFAGLYKLIGLPVVPVAVNSGPLYQGGLKRSGTITYRFGEAIPTGLPREEIEARVIEAINALNN